MNAPASTWLRLEGVIVFVASLLAYQYFALPWKLFLVCFILPDLSMLAYLVGPRIGAWLYNLAHTYLIAVAVLITGLLTGQWTAFAIGLIHCAHIAFDRGLGYGLKLPTGFRHTHLGTIGRDTKMVKAKVK